MSDLSDEAMFARASAERERGEVYDLSEIPMTDHLPLLERIKVLELENRRLMWSNHFHERRYGDDGEMQCQECLAISGVCDYLRAPMAEVRKAYHNALLHHAALLTQEPKP